MSMQRKHAATMVGALWLGVIALSALFASGPIHRADIPAHWSTEFFLTTVLGPLAVFRWPYAGVHPSTSDYVLSILFTAAVLTLTRAHIRQPARWSGWAVVSLMGLWLLLGLGVTYAWV